METLNLEYDVIFDSDVTLLIAKVNQRVQDGNNWHPLGGIATLKQEGNWVDGMFYQAMYRIDNSIHTEKREIKIPNVDRPGEYKVGEWGS